MTHIFLSSHLLNMKLITVWKGRMPDGRVVRDICHNHQIQKQHLFFSQLDFNIGIVAISSSSVCDASEGSPHSLRVSAFLLLTE